MFPILLIAHSITRWFVVTTLSIAIYRGIRGWRGAKEFTRRDDSLRHGTATFSHIQMMIGYLLYFNSPFISYFRSHFKEAIQHFDFVFFGILHITLMTIAVIIITIGSSAAKRQQTDLAKFRIMTICFIVAAIIIFIAIPWPFSPLATRPYLRIF
ncbi:hypothetical protein [Dyadobacter sp. Leaf189]|uniref:hypothetical protein n=1 Tax=Dyadobacter sp. Leaf189 TaxID=1736295 RepID=UPI0006F47AF5|nr:hypothetical protein [Dyadobacter sp. Leaf189]KQS26996.1 hypothetical protein ASG33_20885 [Dyadobacter sp. Leaf189]